MSLAPLPAGITETGAWTLLQLLAKSTLVLALAALVARPLRRAAARHLVWSLALGALLVLPPLTALLPAWRLAWLRVSTQAAAAAAPSLPAAAAPEGPAPVALLFGALWAAGALAVLGRMVMGWYGIRRLARLAHPVRDAAARDELAELCAASGVSATVRLLRSEAATMPATWGVARPAVLLPAQADEWTPERRRVVLLHELAHVARRDWLTQTLATLCCAAYWFHPGAWWAARRMRIEREQACDDRVLAAGARPSDYAGHLLEVARAFRRASTLSSAALAMARPSQLEARVRAVLDGRRDRRGVAYGAGAALAGGVALVLLPLASAMPTEQVRMAVRPVAPRPLPVVAEQRAPSERPVRRVAVATPSAEPAPSPAQAAPRVAAAPAPAPAGPLPLATSPDEEDGVLDASVLRSRSLAQLIRATASPQASVRRDAVRALAMIRDEAVVTPLARSLRDQDAGVRSMAARALGDLAMVRPRPGPSEPVDGAAPAPEPPAEAAAYALATRAAQALRSSLADGDPDVRDTALRALEEVGDTLDSAGGGAIAPSTLQNGMSTIAAPAN